MSTDMQGSKKSLQNKKQNMMQKLRSSSRTEENIKSKTPKNFSQHYEESNETIYKQQKESEEIF